ncbi:peptidase inhibitor family I36 protein [Kribbella sp. NBC_01245]|uniref:peptidase inhibitor family I36 protein n=1 Tax=Kribbella sp. NBC_01245 TaxID=2903578 RepID=UPI002E28BFFD|nr:peptidase inhibitor family I36 protein [Kribbella sp. NBC_01245]
MKRTLGIFSAAVISLVAPTLPAAAADTADGPPRAPATQQSPGLKSTFGPASASQCNSGYACLWGNRDWSGGPWRQENDPGLYNTGYWNNDETSSVWNRQTNYRLWLYNRENGSTTEGVVCVPKMYGVKNLDDYNFDDRVSSFRLDIGSCPSGTTTIGSYKPNP